ncbi:hypothetical protein [Azospirillum sp. sgz302134]
MPARHNDRTDKPSVIDLVTDPEKFDQWQRQREREEASDSRSPDDSSRNDRRQTGDPRDDTADRNP